MPAICCSASVRPDTAVTVTGVFWIDSSRLWAVTTISCTPAWLAGAPAFAATESPLTIAEPWATAALSVLTIKTIAVDTSSDAFILASPPSPARYSIFFEYENSIA